MANPWFRVYSEFATDAKVQSMSEPMQRRLMMLFCLRCSDVLVTLSDDEIAFQLRISDTDLAETKALFVRKGFVNEAWEIANWDKRQFVSDSSAQRTAAYRERQKNKVVTSQKRDGDALDTDTDSKTEPDPEKPNTVSVPDDPDDVRKCPVGTLVNLYHELMPNNPKVKVLSDARKAAIRARWKEASKFTFAPFGYATRSEGLEKWRTFFDVCAGSDFLTGMVPPKAGQKLFVADIDFIFSPTGFAKILENKYHGSLV